jgi:hypothetical protein
MHTTRGKIRDPDRIRQVGTADWEVVHFTLRPHLRSGTLGEQSRGSEHPYINSGGAPHNGDS